MAAVAGELNLNGQSHEATTHWLVRRRLSFACLVALVGAAISLSLFCFLQRREQQLAEARFKFDASLPVEAIQRAVRDRLVIVDMMVAFFAASDDVSRSEFRAFTRPSLTQQRGIHTLGWAPRVLANQREAFEQSIRESDLGDYGIKERNEQQQFVPAAQRDQYCPVLFREPIPMNYPLFGFDLLTIPAFRESIDLAMTSGHATTVLYAPLDGHHTRVDQLYVLGPVLFAKNCNEIHQKDVYGVLVGAFDVDRIVEDALESVHATGIDVFVLDESAPGEAVPIYARFSDSHNDSLEDLWSGKSLPEPTGLHHSGDVTIADRVWTIDCTPQPSYLARGQTWWPHGALLVGLGTTVLLVGYLMLLMGRTAKVEALVAERTTEMRTISNAVLDALIITDPAGNIAHWNAASERIFGYSLNEVLGKSVRDVILCVSDQEQANEDLPQSAVNDQGPIVGRMIERKARRKDGAVFPVEMSVAPLPLRDGRWAVAVVRDITNRKNAEDSLRKEQRLLRDLLNLHEHDRQLVAYEIHDGLTQQLTGALYKLQGIAHWEKEDPARAAAIFEEAMQLLREAMAEARRLIGGLRPPILDESGIVAAIEYLIGEQRQRGGPDISFTSNVRFDRLAGVVESAIFRIVQESLTNACRYSESKRIHVQLTQIDDRIQVRVQDWGIGFNPNAIQGSHFGLRGVRERARLLDGHAVIDSAPGNGTSITVELPLLQATSEATGTGNGGRVASEETHQCLA